MEFHKTCTGHWSDTIDWFTTTSLLLSSSTFARPSCMNDSSSKSWRHFDQISVVLLIRWYLMPTESQNQPLSYVGGSQASSIACEECPNSPPLTAPASPPHVSSTRLQPLLDPDQDRLPCNNLVLKCAVYDLSSTHIPTAADTHLGPG